MAKKEKKDHVHASGKRKRAIARATVRPGTGVIRINSMHINTMEPEVARLRIQEPVMLAGESALKVDIDVNVCGGGWSGQVEAGRLAIAKALAEYFGEEMKKTFLDYDRHMLVADTRFKEARKFGTHSRARAKRQKSYR
ncbi:MAG TPA: 30S ribosomal protein S9 [Nanoarchaeota archaeon]|nr:30S ribosomal protein S9 [Nanoarchaeota archaeon]